MRKKFGEVMVELARRDKDVYLITGDIGYQVFDDFRRLFPERFINFGIKEQSMISFASGMALQGLKPYVYTITPFLIERPFEQIKIDIDQQNVNVKLVGYADYPGQGPTHAELDPRFTLSQLKNLKLYFPRNSDETHKAVMESYESEKPTFISLKKDNNQPSLTKTMNMEELKRELNNLSEENINQLSKLVENRDLILILGNGGSNSVASHIAQDYTKALGKKSVSFSDPSRLTCYINDFGMENAYSQFAKDFATNKSLVILISSSGNSENIYRACETCRNQGIDFIILTGFDENNRIKRDFAESSKFNYWVDSRDYGVVENLHSIFLHSIL
ncbi:hypothetical protein CMI42_02000 [Candidatus Pacearchaeota archaeon]|nr:hypothetical protein [Candidatus Pacearchaeota archaeon]